jgi:hypothetical protein
MAEDYRVRLQDGRTVVNVRQPHRRADHQVWVGWQGAWTRHRRLYGTSTIEGRWHLTILNRDRPNPPLEESIYLLTAWGDQLLRDIGELEIAVPPRPRREDMEYPRLYVVRVSTRAHGMLSTLMHRMEIRLGLAHIHRENYHISVDEAEEEYELVD